MGTKILSVNYEHKCDYCKKVKRMKTRLPKNWHLVKGKLFCSQYCLTMFQIKQIESKSKSKTVSYEPKGHRYPENH